MARPLNIAHRGGAGLWPENTIYAFTQAASNGFDGAELDVQLSRDGKLVVVHDFRPSPELCRNERGGWLTKHYPPVCDLDFEELQAFDVGRPRPGGVYARMHPRLEPRDGERMPLLSEVIAAVCAVNEHFLLFVEIKSSLNDPRLSASPEAIAGAAIEVLRKAGFCERAVLVGFDWRALLQAKRMEPTLPCWFTTRASAFGMTRMGQARWTGGFGPLRFGGPVPQAIKGAGGDGWFCADADATPNSVEEARGLGLSFGVWTVNDKERMRTHTALGVDAICTDRPDMLAAVFEGRYLPPG